MSAIDDRRLDELLASVGRHLDVDAGEPIAHVRHWPRRALTVAAVIVVVVVAVLAIAPVRRTVADWFGIGSTTVVHVPGPLPTIGPLPSITTGLAPIDPAEAERRLGRALPDTTGTALGGPQALAAMPEGGVLMVWADGTTLWVHDRAAPPQVLLKKLIGSDQEARFVDDLGDGALAISGEHILETPRRKVAAGNVVLWTAGPNELRLESARDVDTMIVIARQVR